MRRDCSFISVTELEKPFNSSDEDMVNCWVPGMEFGASETETTLQGMTGQRLEKRECVKVDRGA